MIQLCFEGGEARAAPALLLAHLPILSTLLEMHDRAAATQGALRVPLPTRRACRWDAVALPYAVAAARDALDGYVLPDDDADAREELRFYGVDDADLRTARQLRAEVRAQRGAVADLARRVAVLYRDIEIDGIDIDEIYEGLAELPRDDWRRGGPVAQDAGAWKQANAAWLAPIKYWVPPDAVEPLNAPLEPLASIVYDALTRPL